LPFGILKTKKWKNRGETKKYLGEDNIIYWISLKKKKWKKKFENKK
jgi:hypothetical protein